MGIEPAKDQIPSDKEKLLLSKPVFWGIAIVLAVISLAGLLTAKFLLDGYRVEQRHAEITSQNLAKVLRDNLQGKLSATDIILRDSIHEYLHQRTMGKGRPDTARVDDYLTAQARMVPSVLRTRISTADGIINFGENTHTSRTDISDRDFFIAHRDHPELGLFIGQPVLARIEKQWVITISRRISNPDGSFEGVAWALSSLNDLSNSFAEVSIGPKGAVVLFDQNRSIFTRYPSSEGPGAVIGLKINSKEFIGTFEKNPQEATYQATSTTDNIRRTYSYQKIGDTPLYVMVGLADDDFLAEWHLQRNTAFGLFLLFSLVVMLIAGEIFKLWVSRSKTLAELERSNSANTFIANRLKQVLETAADGIIGLDCDSKVTFANPAAAAILGYGSVGELLERRTTDCLGHHLADGQDCTEGFCSIRASLKDGEVRSVENETFSTKNGVLVPLRYTVSPMAGGAVLAFHDISASKAMEAELHRSNAELEQFAYVAAHDLRAPLRHVTSYVSLLERACGEALSSEAKDYIAFARDGARRMDGMIVALLDYSRIGRNQVTQSVSLVEAAQEALLNLHAAIQESGGQITLPEILPQVRGVRAELVRLFQNLLSNGLKYREPGRAPEIAVTCQEAGKQWRIEVRDNGIGIAPEDRDRAFALFQRLVTRERYEGTGIGLAACKKIVANHGGQIWIEANPARQGSCFVFSLPKS